MRTIKKTQIELGATPIEDITFDLQSRDDICARRITGTLHKRRTRLFAILEKVIPRSKWNKGRPGMPVWTIFVLAMLKQGLRRTFNRLQNLANQYNQIRQMIGYGLATEHKQ